VCLFVLAAVRPGDDLPEARRDRPDLADVELPSALDASSCTTQRPARSGDTSLEYEYKTGDTSGTSGTLDLDGGA
jgi:hypothetical protein